MQAIILAAGMGKRLKTLTKHHTKCMVPVNGVALIERMLSQLDTQNLSRIIMVTGYKEEVLIDFVKNLQIKTPILFVTNPIYEQSNNIYSLLLAREYLEKEDTLLLESDLIFEDSALTKIIENPQANLVLVAKYEHWMDGTVVSLDSGQNIKAFVDKGTFKFEHVKDYYKTVNIYKFSQGFSKNQYIPFLEAYCKAFGNNEYYEQVLKSLTLLGEASIKAEILEKESWYEIDTAQDLRIAETLFTNSPQEKFDKLHACYGGYWRYPKLIDFSYLVNPFFPTQKLMTELKASFEVLTRAYPSGMQVNRQLAADMFDIESDNILVGNGAAELINALLNQLSGKTGIIRPTFDEYPNRKNHDDLVVYCPDNENCTYTVDDLIDYYSEHPISNLVIINPDNPSGNYISRTAMIQLVHWAQRHNITLVLDESFIDYADAEESGSLLDEDMLEAYPNLVIIKSLSKSYGIPGLRLGILATGNIDLINRTRDTLPIWNINSYGEFFMQIFDKHKDDYRAGLKRFFIIRKNFSDQLSAIKHLRAIPSQANYIMCEVTNRMRSKQVAETLLDQHHILIKDLSSKNGLIGRQIIRVAVKTERENTQLAKALRDILH